ncbi:MAG: aldo/keto reductase [Sedimentisphaerales bacterium]|jgi:aryl-alcohol dehydrogenase-like predicted oxidoreductase
MERREFLKKSTIAAGTIAASRMLDDAALTAAGELQRDSESGNPATLPRREYGQTGVKLSIIGLGGIVVKDAEQQHANRVVAEAFERGVNYFDVAPTYGDAELKLGPALEPYRKKVFLACKTTERRREGASEELRESLKRLRTDHLDLYQLHAITDVKKDVDVAFAKGGAMEVFVEAKKQGQVRYLGFSAHSEEAALAAMERYDFDSILFPVNFATFFKGEFGPRVIATAKSKGLAILALKALARQRWPQNDPSRKKYPKCWYQPLTQRDEAKLGLYFTLSQPVTAAIPPGEESLFRMALDLAMSFKPLSTRELETAKQTAGPLNPVFQSKA